MATNTSAHKHKIGKTFLVFLGGDRPELLLFLSFAWSNALFLAEDLTLGEVSSGKPFGFNVGILIFSLFDSQLNLKLCKANCIVCLHCKCEDYHGSRMNFVSL